MSVQVNELELRDKVVDMYRRVANDPSGKFHFEMGRALAERLGYRPRDLDRVPAEAVDSFAGVGYHFGLADLQEGERVLDLGSGSGMDTFVAALKVGDMGKVVGIDMTDAQLEKAEKLKTRDRFETVSYVEGRLESLPFEDDAFDVVISNGVINLCADKGVVFKEIARVLRTGGRLALSDIVSRSQLPESIVCDSTLWAACIGGAMQIDEYRLAIKMAGMRVDTVEGNAQYQFLSGGARGATADYGVHSVSLVATRV